MPSFKTRVKAAPAFVVSSPDNGFISSILVTTASVEAPTANIGRPVLALVS